MTRPTKVAAVAYMADAVEVGWESGSEGAVRFRVERRIADGKWHVIAYRPPRPQGDPENPREWIDFTAPPGKDLTYRVVTVDAGDTDGAAREPSGAVNLVPLTR